MSAKTVLEVDGISEDFNVKVMSEMVSIYNNATDAAAWYIEFSFEDWKEIKSFIDSQIKE